MANSSDPNKETEKNDTEKPGGTAAPKDKKSPVKSATSADQGKSDSKSSGAGKSAPEKEKPAAATSSGNATGGKASGTTAETNEAKKDEAPAAVAAREKPGGTQPKASSSVPGTPPGKPSSAPAEDKSAGGFRLLLGIVIVVAVVGAGAYAGRDVWLPKVAPYLAEIPGFGNTAQPDTDQPSQFDALNSRLQALESRLADGGLSRLTQEKDRLQAELNTALGRIDDLERRLADVRELAAAVTNSAGSEVDLSPVLSRLDSLETQERDTRAEVADLAERLEAMPTEDAGGVASGLVLAVAQLRDAAMSGRPFESQLEALGALAQGNPEITAAAGRLRGLAGTGLPSASRLEDRFAAIAADIVTLARAGNGGWMDRAAGRLSQLVSLRRTDGESGNPVEDAVAQIESALVERDVTAAVAVASRLADTLDGEAKAMLETWLSDAKARADAVRAMNAMHAAALAGLGG